MRAGGVGTAQPRICSGDSALSGGVALRTAETIADTLRETWFWSQVLSDHAGFILDHLAPSEAEPVRWAASFRQALTELHSETHHTAQSAGIAGPAGSYALAGPPLEQPLSGRQGPELTHYAGEVRRLGQSLLQATQSLRAFKEDLLGQQLGCQVRLNLPPTLIAHMIVEAEEAQRALSAVGTDPQPAPAQAALHHHLIWLPDAAGHAAVLHSGLDPTETQLQRVTMDFKQIFDGMHIKSLELRTMQRLAPRMVAALSQLNRDAMGTIATFRSFLAELREHLEGCTVLGTLMPNLADHMLREELYYTEKLAALTADQAGSGGAPYNPYHS